MTTPKRPDAIDDDIEPWWHEWCASGVMHGRCLCTTSIVLDRVLVNLNRECPRHGVKSCK